MNDKSFRKTIEKRLRPKAGVALIEIVFLKGLAAPIVDIY
jgi:hypothetical protein